MRRALQQLFETTFYYYLVATYGDALHWFRADTLTLMADQAPEFSNSHAAKTLLKRHDGQTHQVQFYLRRSGERWFVIDVIVDGVSYARTYSSDLRSIIRHDGLDGLIGWLADMANENSSAAADQ